MVKRKTFLHFFLLAFITLLICLIFTEIIFQIIDYPKTKNSPYKYSKITGIQYTPNLDTIMSYPSEYSVSFKTNSLGLRDDEIRKEKTKFRVLFLGDSWVSGHGVERSENFAELLENELGVEIINSGTAGFELINYLKFFRYYGKLFKPDLTVLFLYLGNDLMNQKFLGDSENRKFEQYWENQVGSPKEETGIKLYLLIKRSLGGKKQSEKRAFKEWEPGEYISLYFKNPDENSKKEFELSKNILREINEEVLKTGSEIIIVLIPIKTFVNPVALKRFKKKFWNFEKIFDLDRPRRELGLFLTKNKIQYIDLTDDMKSHHLSSGASLHFFSDGHFNQRGHRFMYEKLKESLKLKNNKI